MNVDVRMATFTLPFSLYDCTGFIRGSWANVALHSCSRWYLVIPAACSCVAWSWRLLARAGPLRTPDYVEFLSLVRCASDADVKPLSVRRRMTQARQD